MGLPGMGREEGSSAQVTATPVMAVFVYGTLMPGERNAAVAAVGGAAPHGVSARVEGFVLLDLRPEGYPALRRRVVGEGAAGEGGPVHGVLLRYTVPDWARALPLLDELEGVDELPPLYTREQVEVRLDGGETTVAWLYVYADEARLERPGVTEMPTGRWTDAPDRFSPSPGER